MSDFTIEVHLFSRETGEVRIYRSDYRIAEPWSDFIWSEGNFSCDCNRGDFFAEAGGEESPDHRACSENLYSIDKIVRTDTGEVLYTESRTGPTGVWK